MVLRVLIFAMFLGASPALGQGFSGTLHVVDGDTFDVGDVRVRLFGVDAVERSQTCIDRAGTRWACGEWVVGQVTAAFEGKTADCEPQDTDRYGRVVAKCTVAGEDLGAVLVGNGLAQAYRLYSMDYDLIEKGASLQQLGLWSSSTQVPADYRHSAAPVVPAQSAPVGCAIKGNISASGRIYHVPGQQDYDNTRINARDGERWFCSEAEAQAAGWRRARR